jgi:acyl carrier protein
MITADAIRSIINETIIGVDGNALSIEKVFKEAGIDSLDQLNILLAIEEKFELRIPDEDVKSCNSIQAILNYFSIK